MLLQQTNLLVIHQKVLQSIQNHHSCIPSPHIRVLCQSCKKDSKMNCVIYFIATTVQKLKWIICETAEVQKTTKVAKITKPMQKSNSDIWEINFRNQFHNSVLCSQIARNKFFVLKTYMTQYIRSIVTSSLKITHNQTQFRFTCYVSNPCCISK